MKSEKKYVVGYAGKAQTAIYTSGRTWQGGMEKMTYLQAKKEAKSLKSPRAKVSIFELVPVDTDYPKNIK